MTTLFVFNETLESVPDKLEGNKELAIVWFENNYVKLSTDKWNHLTNYVIKSGKVQLRS